MSTAVLGDMLVKYRAEISDLTSKTNQAKSSIKEVGDTAKKASEATKSGFGDMLKGAFSFATGMAVYDSVGAAISGVKDQFLDLIKVANEHAQIEAQTTQVLKSTHDVSGMTASSLDDLAAAFSKTTEFSADTVQGGENLLLTFTNIGKGVFPQATQAILDVSQAMGQDLKSSAIQVGKALGDPLTGMTALQRIGVTFSASEKEQIKTMMAHNNIIGAQKVILKELSTEFGGSATAAGKTFGGQMDILKNKMEDWKIKIGTAVLPLVQKLISGFISIGEKIMSVAVPAFQAIMKYLNSDAFAGVVADFQTIGNQIGTILGPALQQIGPLFMAAFQQIGPVLTGTIIPAIDNVVFGFGQFLLFMQTANPWVQVIKDGLLAIGLAFAAMKIAEFISTLPALITRLGVWAAGQWAVAAATIATAAPYILAGAVVAAVTFGVIMAIQHWGQIMTWLKGVWSTVSGWIGDRFSWLGDHVHAIISSIGSLFDWIGTRVHIFFVAWSIALGAAGAVFSQFGSFVQGIVDAVGNAFSGLGSLISGVWNGIVGAIRDAINWIIGLVNGFISGIDSIGVDIGPIHIHPNIPHIPSLDTGIENFSGGLALVHKNEVLMNLSKGTSVLPASTVNAAMRSVAVGVPSSGGSQGQTFILEVDSVQLAQITQRATDRIVRLRLGPNGRAA